VGTEKLNLTMNCAQWKITANTKAMPEGVGCYFMGCCANSIDQRDKHNE